VTALRKMPLSSPSSSMLLSSSLSFDWPSLAWAAGEAADTAVTPILFFGGASVKELVEPVELRRNLLVSTLLAFPTLDVDEDRGGGGEGGIEPPMAPSGASTGLMGEAGTGEAPEAASLAALWVAQSGSCLSSWLTKE
jgi:hypothetical protein